MPTSLHPHQPRTLAQLDDIPQTLDKHTVQPQQGQVEQIAAAAFESQSGPPVFQ